MRRWTRGLAGLGGHTAAWVSCRGSPEALPTAELPLGVDEKGRWGARARVGTRKLGTVTAPPTAVRAGRNACVKAVRRHVWAALIEVCGIGSGWWVVKLECTCGGVLRRYFSHP
jgi:hypothetical protein